MQESIVFLVRVQCRCKESSRSLSHLLMSFLFIPATGIIIHKHHQLAAQRKFRIVIISSYYNDPQSLRILASNQSLPDVA